MVSFPPVSPPRPYTPSSPHPYAPHAQPISFFLILSPAQYWVTSTDHLASRYAIPPVTAHTAFSSYSSGVYDVRNQHTCRHSAIFCRLLLDGDAQMFLTKSTSSPKFLQFYQDTPLAPQSFCVFSLNTARSKTSSLNTPHNILTLWHSTFRI